jgi:hypothetical protein
MLPKLDIPTYEISLVSNDQKIKFRPFLVKEEKILLMALESGQENDILRAIKQILQNCIITEINIDDLPLFDLQYIFLQLRARSVGETIEVRLRHRDGINKNGVECDGTQLIKINIDEIRPSKNKKLEPKIELSKDIGIVLKYPTVDILDKISTTSNTQGILDNTFEIVAESVDYIYEKDEIYHRKDHKKEEFVEFLNNLNSEQFEKIKEFFSNMPTMSLTKNYRCKKCGIDEELELKTLEDFFS